MARTTEQQHIACICDPGDSHIMNFAAIGRELERSGHRFTVFQAADLEPKISAEGLDFWPLAKLGTVVSKVECLRAPDGSIREFLHQSIQKAILFCEQAPQSFESAGVDGVIVDMSEPGGATAAEAAGLPFVTICNALPLHSEPSVPPEFLPWHYSDSIWAKLRNQVAYSVRDYMIRRLNRVLNRYRRKWHLRPYHSPDDSLSPLAQITHLVPEFDFPRKRLPGCLHYVGPYRRASSTRTRFPYERLNGSPLVYASLGTVLGGRLEIWRAIAEGCRDLPVQLVISTGGQAETLDLSSARPNTIVVNYAPQLELLKRAAVTITHGGLNSVMEALAAGVPMLALPICNDQFGVAARIAYTRAGEVIAAEKCTAPAISAAVRKIFDDPGYRERGSAIRGAIEKTRGASDAAAIIEEAVATRRPVLRDACRMLKPAV